MTTHEGMDFVGSSKLMKALYHGINRGNKRHCGDCGREILRGQACFVAYPINYTPGFTICETCHKKAKDSKFINEVSKHENIESTNSDNFKMIVTASLSDKEYYGKLGFETFSCSPTHRNYFLGDQKNAQKVKNSIPHMLANGDTIEINHKVIKTYKEFQIAVNMKIKAKPTKVVK